MAFPFRTNSGAGLHTPLGAASRHALAAALRPFRSKSASPSSSSVRAIRSDRDGCSVFLGARNEYRGSTLHASTAPRSYDATVRHGARTLNGDRSGASVPLVAGGHATVDLGA